MFLFLQVIGNVEKHVLLLQCSMAKLSLLTSCVFYVVVVGKHSGF